MPAGFVDLQYMYTQHKRSHATSNLILPWGSARALSARDRYLIVLARYYIT